MKNTPFQPGELAVGDSVGVAVLDTGIDGSHVDLPGLSGGTNTVDATDHGADGHSHGTHIAGTIVAS